MLSLGQKASNGRTVLTLLYQQPYVTANEVALYLDVTLQTAIILIRAFMRLGILGETTG